MVIHHTNSSSWILLTTVENKEAAPNQFPTPQHCQEQTLPGDNPMKLEMLSKDSFGFSDHATRFCVPVGENIEDYRELIYKKSLFSLSA